MKTTSTLITLFCLFSIAIWGQQNTDIFYNPHKNTFTGENELKKGTNVSIYIENYNPFIYSYNVEITTKDNTKKLFEFLSGILVSGFGIEPINKNIVSTNTLANFNQLKEKYLDLQNELKNPYFDYTIIKNKITVITQSKNIYTEYLNLAKADRDNLVLTKAEIIELSETKIAAKYYLDNQLESKNGKYYLKVGDYKVTGSSSAIKITLLNRTENNKDSIVGMKKIDVKNAGKIDFSTGMFFTQNNEPQYFKSQLTNGNYKIGLESLNKYQIGINALTHIYLSKKNNFNITLGSGITIDKAIHLLTGISYKFSNSNIILNLGVDFSNYNELSDAFELEKEYTTDIEIKTKKRWNDAIWFGISYKL
jgi:hypothetical protein